MTEEIKKEEKKNKVCVDCGRMEGNGVVIKRGRIGRDDRGNFMPESICQLCAQIERTHGGKVYKWKILLEKVAFLNEQRKKRLKERREREFSRAIKYWWDVEKGKAAPPEIRKENGKLLCGVAGCKCKSWGKPATHYAVVGGKIIGLCAFQFVTLKTSRVKIMASRHYSLCQNIVSSLERRRAALKRVV